MGTMKLLQVRILYANIHTHTHTHTHSHTSIPRIDDMLLLGPVSRFGVVKATRSLNPVFKMSEGGALSR